MKKDHQDAILHFLMAMIGGFLGGYAIFARMNIFGSAQTANLIELIKNIFGANYVESLMRIGALLIYILAIMIATVLTYKSQWNLKHLVLYLEMICIVILGFIPEDIPPIIALYPCFFVTAFQWCIFKGAMGYTSSTIFSTNNIKQTVVSLTEYFLIQDTTIKQEKLKKGCFFGGTLLCFHCGVALSYLLWSIFSLAAIWFLMIPVSINLGYLIYIEKYAYPIQHTEKMI